MKMMTWLPILSAFITGFLGAYFGSWAKWYFEKQKLRYNTRKELIAKVRKLLEPDIYQNSDFRQSNVYLQIKPYLSVKIIDQINKPGQKSIHSSESIFIDLTNDGIRINNYRIEILNEINEIEKKWKLI